MGSGSAARMTVVRLAECVLPLRAASGAPVCEEVMAMTREIELKLVGAAAPSGEIAAKDLVSLASALQELTTRIARDVVSTPGPGRSMQVVEEFVQLRLRAVEAGSTVLRFAKGPIGRLDVDLPEEGIADDRFWEVIQAVAEDRRPDSVTDLIAESVGRLVSAIKAAAPEVVLGSPNRRPVNIRAEATHIETWSMVRVQTGGVTTATGRLEKVDLRSHEFRLRDDVGHTVELKHVEDDTAVAKLVGQWVIAEGAVIPSPSGRLVLDNARVQEIVDPAAEYVGRRVVPVEEILASAPGPEPDAGIDLTDDEMVEFLKAIRS